MLCAHKRFATAWLPFAERIFCCSLCVQRRLQPAIDALAPPWNRARLCIFGSSANNFGSPKSDADLCLVLPQPSVRSMLLGAVPHNPQWSESQDLVEEVLQEKGTPQGRTTTAIQLQAAEASAVCGAVGRRCVSRTAWTMRILASMPPKGE